MLSDFWTFFSTEGFHPHGNCLLWRPDVFVTHIVADSVIALSYFSIPIALVYFAFHRTDFRYRWVLFLFGGFIVACGVTHVFGIWTLFYPDYGLQAALKVFTALISIATAVALWPLMPRLLRIPSTKELGDKNKALAAEVATRHAVEMELRRLNNELEARVAHRTAELEDRNADLIVAREVAEKSNQAKSEFLAAMSHEVRTPMNGLLGMLDVLEDDHLTGQQKEIVNRAHDAADGLLAIINDILDYSKLEAGSVELTKLAFSPAQALRQAVDLFRNRAEAKGLTLSLHGIDTMPPWLIGDARRLGQVLANLIGNAIKFTEEGHVAVLATHRTERGGIARVTVAIEDTGIGIDAAAQAELFQRFYQGHASTSRRFGGTGLGLAISKQLVELMGGDIRVTSEMGHGSMFELTARFPLGAVSEAAALNPQEPDAEPLERLCILVAEDNETNQFHLEQLLGRAGHCVDIVPNGVEAVRAAERTQYDVILMDIYMPEMDGTIAAKIIKSLDGPARRTPIVALTANAMVGDRQYYLSEGMDEYVSKPIDPSALFSAIWRVVMPGHRPVLA